MRSTVNAIVDYLFGCNHTFGFPMTRRSTHFTYQTCTKCGTQFVYDWASMSRRQRIGSTIQPNTNLVPSPSVKMRTA